MQLTRTLFLTAGLALGLCTAATTLAQDGKPAEAAKQPEAAQPAGEAPTGEMGKAMQEAAMKALMEAQQKKPIPVPDLPIVKKTELADGLIAEDMKIGDGYEIKDEKAVVVAHYHGTLKADGKKFDSSYERGEPVSFPLSGVIKGWTKGVPGMKVGGIRKLTIPAAMAYGAESPSPEIPPNSDLVFVIELVGALQVEDVKVGDGEEVGSRPICITAYTITGQDGKVIESCGKDKPFVWLPGEHQGINFGLEGMKVGGKRKLTIPAPLNVTAQGVPGVTRPSNVPVTVEIELINVKNLVPPQPKAP